MGNIYLKYPIFGDVLVIVVLWTLKYFFSVCCYNYLNEESIKDLFGNIIGTSISLAGFVVAALTIVVTLKSAIKISEDNENKSAIELALFGTYYHQIVGIFRYAVIEMVIVIAFLYAFWLLPSDFFNSTNYTLIAICAVFCILTTIFRTLYVVFKIIEVDQIPKPRQKRDYMVTKEFFEK